MSGLAPGKTAVRGGAVALAIAVGLVACARPEVPVDHFYRLGLATPPTPAPAGLVGGPIGVIEIDRPVANGVVAGRAIVRSGSASPATLTTYHYHYWAEPPADLLRDALVTCARGSGIADLVVTREMRVRADVLVFGRVKRLEHASEADLVIVEMDLGVRSNRDGALLHLETYSVEEPVEAPTVAAAVAAFDRALARVCLRWIGDASAAIAAAS